MEAAGPGGDARIAALNVSTLSLPTVWDNVDLGVPADGNVDAISYPWPLPEGNVIPPRGPAMGGMLALRQVCNATYTVDRDSTGPLGTVVNLEFLGNGAAGDSFRIDPFRVPPLGVLNSAVLWTDNAPCLVTAGTGVLETDVDALTKHADGAVYPVFFSVDPATSMTLPLGDPGGTMTAVSGADLLVAVSPGVAFILLPASDMGLTAADDIDAVSVDQRLGHFVYSLTEESPSAQLSYPGIGQLGGAGLYAHYVGVPAVIPWASPSQLGLRAPTGAFGTMMFTPGDELNGVAIGDPKRHICLQ